MSSARSKTRRQKSLRRPNTTRTDERARSTWRPGKLGIPIRSVKQKDGVNRVVIGVNRQCNVYGSPGTGGGRSSLGHPSGFTGWPTPPAGASPAHTWGHHYIYIYPPRVNIYIFAADAGCRPVAGAAAPEPGGQSLCMTDAAEGRSPMRAFLTKINLCRTA